MPYQIELMSIGEDHYSILAAAADSLNAVQQEFQFRLTSESQRQVGIAFHRKDYYSPDIWTFLRENRVASGGNRPYIIAFINAPLASQELRNLFGSHEAKEGLAVVTLHQSTQYVKETRRYCCYFLVRYSMSFVNPLIKVHDNPDRKDCYFHKKMFKPEIRLAMDSGNLCDDCLSNLEKPSAPSVGKPLSAEEHEALKQMRAVVSDDYPRALIMKGGGVKGLAFAGALLELEKYFWFDVHVGASAGAITAVLLAANYSPTELSQLLIKKSFREFMDAPIFLLPFNLLARQGLYPGKHFLEWMTKMLREKIEGIGDIKMRDLPKAMRNSGKDAVIYACTSGSGTVVFDSRGERKDENAAFATRCSMSIPIFFMAPQIAGRRVYDGGLRNNFPLTRFLEDNPLKPFIALYLGKADDSGTKWIWAELADIWITGEEYKAVDSHRESVIVIDTTPIGTVDFRLTDKEKEFLLKVGRASALRFLYERNLDDGPVLDIVETAEVEAESSRRAVVTMRRRRRVLRTALFVVALALMFAFGYWMWFRQLPIVQSANQPQSSQATKPPSSVTPVMNTAQKVKAFSLSLGVLTPSPTVHVELIADRIVNDDQTPAYLLTYSLKEKRGADFLERVRVQVNLGNDPRVENLTKQGLSEKQAALLAGPMAERAKTLPASTRIDKQLSALLVSLLDKR